MNDPHALAQQELALLALGEDVDPAVAAHVETCPQCRPELRAYRELVEVARAAGRAPESTSPPPRVWDGILTALGDDAPRTSSAQGRQGPPVRQDTPAPAPSGTAAAEVTRLDERRRRRWTSPLVSVAAAVALVVAGVVGWSIGNRGGTTAAQSSQAVLAPQPGTPAAVQGRAVVHRSDDGYTLQVETDQLPAPQGYYEVWLYNPSINQMVAVGTLGTKARGSFTVPAGIDLNAYHVVDVSAQRYNGNNTHERSVLRGSLES